MGEWFSESSSSDRREGSKCLRADGGRRFDVSDVRERLWIVYVCPNHCYENGDLVVVALKSDEVMIKKLRKSDDMLILQSINPAYEPLILASEGFRFIHKVCLIKPK